MRQITCLKGDQLLISHTDIRLSGTFFTSEEAGGHYNNVKRTDCNQRTETWNLIFSVILFSFSVFC